MLPNATAKTVEMQASVSQSASAERDIRWYPRRDAIAEVLRGLDSTECRRGKYTEVTGPMMGRLGRRTLLTATLPTATAAGTANRISA